MRPGALLPKSELICYSRFDPFFALLEPLSKTAPENGPFIDYIDCMNGIIERAGLNMQILVQVMNTRPNFKSLFIENFCERRTVMDRDLVRISDEKLVKWLKRKVELISQYIISTDVYLVEVSANPEQLAKVTALELVRAYIPEHLYDALCQSLGYNTESVFSSTSQETVQENKEPSNGSTKRLNQEKQGLPPAKKQKEVAIAKSCMKMTAFFKPKS
jgi:hypothetical protein